MNFVIIFGPPAVGKMTVGLELEKLTGIKLFHNHASIELVLNFFDFGTPPFKRLVDNFRRDIFEEVANSDLRGLIFTFVWGLDSDFDNNFVLETCDTFEKVNANILLIELNASLEERLIRNELPDRIQAKPSKRNIANSKKNLLECEKFRMNSDGKELKFPYKHISIDTTKLSANETVQIIIKKLNLATI